MITKRFLQVTVPSSTEVCDSLASSSEQSSVTSTPAPSIPPPCLLEVFSLLAIYSVFATDWPTLLFSENSSPSSFPIHCLDPSWPLTLVISSWPLNTGLFPQGTASAFLFSVYTFSLAGLPAPITLTMLFNSDSSNLIFSSHLLSPLWCCVFRCPLVMSSWQPKSNLCKQLKQLLPPSCRLPSVF